LSSTDGPTARLLSTARDLAVLADRAARHDPATPVRLQASGDVLAAYVATPLECLGLRVSRLREPADFDLVVEAVGLAARARGSADGTLVLPPALPHMAWVSPLPPRSGWTVVGTTSGHEMADRLHADTDEFKRRASEVQPGRGSNAAMEGLAAEVWSRPWLGDAPARLVHAADYLGFLTSGVDDEQAAATVRSSGPWRRLDTALGVTATRISDVLGLFVS
jgi:hypothetical protein